MTRNQAAETCNQYQLVASPKIIVFSFFFRPPRIIVNMMKYLTNHLSSSSQARFKSLDKVKDGSTCEKSFYIGKTETKISKIFEAEERRIAIAYLASGIFCPKRNQLTIFECHQMGIKS